jgi:uncharacterized membrane protein
VQEDLVVDQLECTNTFVIPDDFVLQSLYISNQLEKNAFLKVVKESSRFVADNLYHIANDIKTRQHVIIYDGELPYFFEATISTETTYIGEARYQAQRVYFTKKLLTRRPKYKIKVRIEGKGFDINKTYFTTTYESSNPILITRKINSLLEYLNFGKHLDFIPKQIQS